MATTTNYSWSTPDDTALVKDGAAAIRSLGSAIDSTVFTNASAAINKTIVDVKGDLIAATGADTVSRLAVGTNDQVLTADSTTATGLKWATAAAGGMTQLATGSLSGTSVTINSISGSYRDLVLVATNVFASSSSNKIGLRLNGSSSANYNFSAMNMGATTIAGSFGQTSMLLDGNTTNLPTTTSNNCFITTIGEYAGTNYHPMNCLWSSTGGDGGYTIGYKDDLTAAITSLTLFTSAGANFSGGTYTLYGVK